MIYVSDYEYFDDAKKRYKNLRYMIISDQVIFWDDFEDYKKLRQVIDGVISKALIDRGFLF